MNTSPFLTRSVICLQILLFPYRQLRCIRPYLDSKTASIVHSKLDYCNSSLLLPACPSLRSPGSNRSRTLLHVTSLPSHHIVSALLHWLKITERIEYKLLSLTYKVLTTTQPSNLHNIISVQLFRSTRSSSFVTLARPSTSSSPHITDRSFQYASPRLWNQLSAPLRQPRTNLSNSDSPRF